MPISEAGEMVVVGDNHVWDARPESRRNRHGQTCIDTPPMWR